MKSYTSRIWPGKVMGYEVIIYRSTGYGQKIVHGPMAKVEDK